MGQSPESNIKSTAKDVDSSGARLAPRLVHKGPTIDEIVAYNAYSGKALAVGRERKG